MPNKTPQDQRSQFILGGYFGPFWLPNLIFVHFVCAHFYVYFWHRWEASCINFKDFGVISRSMLGSFCPFLLRVLQNPKHATILRETLVCGGAGPPFLLIFCYLCFKVFFYVGVSNLAELALQSGSLLGSIFADDANSV